jgi:hypothetical protein
MDGAWSNISATLSTMPLVWVKDSIYRFDRPGLAELGNCS